MNSQAEQQLDFNWRVCAVIWTVAVFAMMPKPAASQEFQGMAAGGVIMSQGSAQTGVIAADGGRAVAYTETFGRTQIVGNPVFASRGGPQALNGVNTASTITTTTESMSEVMTKGNAIGAAVGVTDSFGKFGFIGGSGFAGFTLD